MPGIDDLRLVLEAADRSNLGAAARASHVSQSTVSRAVQRVEARLGHDLFDRVGRTVVLREDSRPTLDALRTIVDTWDSLGSTSSSHVTLSLFCTATASQAVVPDLLASFRTARPDVDLRLRTGPASAAIEAVTTSAVDLAIAALPKRLAASLRTKEFARIPLVAVSTPGVGWDAQLILPRTGVTRELVDGWRRKAFANRPDVHDTDSHEEVIALAALGSGVGIVPEIVVVASPLHERLRTLRPPRKLPEIRLGLVARARDLDRSPIRDLWSLVG